MENKVNITNEQVARAAQSVTKLLQDDERVNIPPSLALSGDLTVMMGILGGLAAGQLVVGNPPEGQEALPAAEPAVPANDGEGAVVASTD